MDKQLYFIWHEEGLKEKTVRENRSASLPLLKAAFGAWLRILKF